MNIFEIEKLFKSSVFHHLMDTSNIATLESKVESVFSNKNLAINLDDKSNIMNGLNIIRDYSEDSYSHHLRVGLKTRILIANSQMDHRIMRFFRNSRDEYAFERLGFFSGLLHDIGKTKFDKGFFERDLTPGEREIQKSHVLYSYNEVLKMGYNFSAEMILRHHLFEKDPYPTPDKMPEFSIKQLRENYSGEFTSTEIILMAAARYLSLADHHDAWMHRNNAKNKNGGMTNDQIKEILKEEFPPLSYTIEAVYSKDMFKEL